MTDDNTSENTAAAAQDDGPAFAVQRIYLKDLSFETPMGAGAFQKQWQPKVNQDLNTKSGKVADDLYEVSLRLTVTVTIEEETVYLVEVDQAGLFAIRGLEPNQLTQVINTTCPSLLFPYAREAIDNILTKGSFPALMLPPINFDALFASAVKQAEEQQAQQQSSENSTH
jgi:preprotein translocase subunit SecB